eukprot:10586798-Alexandrium_andersonii.AAC.1
MDVGALEPGPSDADPDAQEPNAAFAALQRWFKGKGKGKAANPAPLPPLAGPRLRAAPRAVGK